jgi:hypothetical protein
MPAIPATHYVRYALGCAVVAVGVAMFFRVSIVQQAVDATSRWGQYHAPAPAGPEEAAIRRLVLGDAPVERRVAGLFAYFSSGFVRHAAPGYTRVHFGGAHSFNGYSVDGLEGFARTGSLLAAWIYSGREGSDEWVEMLRTGIVRGVDPRSSEYWGDIRDYDQRIVEAADIARIVWLTRARIWDTLGVEQKRMIHTWLSSATTKQTPPNNWILFPVVVGVVLASLEDRDTADLLANAHTLFAGYRQYQLDQGWFYDRPHGVDFYNTWGIAYDLFWIHTVAPTFEPDFIVTTLLKSAQLTQYLISPQGIPIMGRSICYRTAVAVPLIAATFLGPGKFPAGRAVRSLDVVWRYFVAHDSLRDGTLTQGYFAADPRFLDRYSGTGSCGWGLRSLLLALMHPAGDEFWTAAPQPLPVEEADYRLELSKLGWIVEGRRDSGEIRLTIVRNERDVTAVEEYSWLDRARDVFSSVPHRPENYEIKYDSRHYSSAAPFPVTN